ncbi:MAG: ABC transporter substrate-binding protein [Eubacteriales bacterium]|nr:ABC transporter substrate-binding protein [Eubacteriales bacterium]
MAGEEDGETEEDAFGNAAGGGRPAEHTPTELPGLVFVSEKDLAYAEAFAIYTYQREESLFRLIDVFGNGGARYLLVPEGAEIPEELRSAINAESQNTLRNISRNASQDNSTGQEITSGQGSSVSLVNSAGALSAGGITVLQAPLENLYVAATSSMALFDAAGAIGQVKLTGTDVKGWYIDAPKQALESGSMIYAGKYSAPDYELLTSSGCDLAVESMMILHAPEVKEKLEELGIPVFIDTSSSESHPMGRTEWVRLYGVLTGHEKEADAFFAGQLETFAETGSYTETGKTAAFFSITSVGNVVVRAADDYIPRMIELAGGEYVFRDLAAETGSSASVRLSMEDFYNTAKDADYLIYNATIEKPVGSIRELCGKFALLSDFKAVREGHVWQARGNLYQSPDIAAQMITDLRRMLTGENESEMIFLEKVGD